MSGDPCEVAVVYLARQAEGIEPIQRFVRSYRDHEAGISHDFIVVFKGYAGKDEYEKAKTCFSGISHREIRVSDAGFDIGAYLYAAGRLEHERICFLNKFTEINEVNWLAKLDFYPNRVGAGIAGAMGSYESLHDSLAFIGKAAWLTELKGIPYDRVLAAYFEWVLKPHAPKWMARRGNNAWHQRLHKAIASWMPGSRPPSDPSSLDREYIEYWRSLLAPGGPLAGYDEFPRFPNPHIRSNCFLINRRLLLSLYPDIGATKQDSYEFESGYASITAQVRQRGLGAFIVDRNGKGYDVPDWPSSRTFRLGDQDGLLVSDNQARSFLELSPEERATHVHMTWGDYVDPPPDNFPTLNFRFRRTNLSGVLDNKSGAPLNSSSGDRLASLTQSKA